MAYDNNYRGGSNEPALLIKVNIAGETVAADLYADQAQRAANACNTGKNGPNASSQLRRFYDELVMWHDKVFAKKTPQEQDEAFQKCLPFIQMLRAKAAYARGRKANGKTLIDETFYQLFDNLIQQIGKPETLKRARLFMEAFLGYKKYFEGK